MVKMLKKVRNIILGILLFVYLVFIILISTLLLNRNQYGVSQFGDKAIIKIKEEVATDNYKKGALVIVEKKSITELKVGDEVFIYKTNKRENSVEIVISDISKINLENKSPYVVLANDNTAWGEEFIAGTSYLVYDDMGAFLTFIESKWIFFCLLIVPCFFILLYEIHLIIVTIKFGDDEFEDEEINDYKDTIESKNMEIEELMKQIKELKKENKTDDKKESK